MHHWEVGGSLNIGWPDYNVPERPYTIVEFDLFGPVLRARVSDASSDGRQGGFLVVFGCPDVVLDMLAEQATTKLGFKVVVSDLRCSIEGNHAEQLRLRVVSHAGVRRAPRCPGAHHRRITGEDARQRVTAALSIVPSPSGGGSGWGFPFGRLPLSTPGISLSHRPSPPRERD